MTDKPNPLIELLVTLIIPSLILMKLSGPADLGAVNALLLALAFPLAWGARDLLARRKLNLFAALGLVSILLTGGIGLLQLDTQWLAIKEAARAETRRGAQTLKQRKPLCVLVLTE